MTSKFQKIDVGRRFAALRLQRGLSQGIVARRAGIAPSYLSRIETGKVHPTLRTMLRIAGGLKTSLGEIVGTKAAAARQGEGCPVSGGQCLLELIRAESEIARGSHGESYTPRQVRLIRRFGAWLHGVSPDRLRAMEVLLEELTREEPSSRR